MLHDHPKELIDFGLAANFRGDSGIIGECVGVFSLADVGARADIAALWRANDEPRMADLRARRIGYVLQTGGLLPFLTVAQNAGSAYNGTKTGLASAGALSVT